jgi:hypothetical protein
MRCETYSLTSLYIVHVTDKRLMDENERLKAQISDLKASIIKENRMVIDMEKKYNSMLSDMEAKYKNRDSILREKDMQRKKLEDQVASLLETNKKLSVYSEKFSQSEDYRIEGEKQYFNLLAKLEDSQEKICVLKAEVQLYKSKAERVDKLEAELLNYKQLIAIMRSSKVKSVSQDDGQDAGDISSTDWHKQEWRRSHLKSK